MTVSEEELRRRLVQDRRAIVIGTAVTVVATLSFFLLADVLPIELFKDWFEETTGIWLMAENPFTPLRFVGGVIGGGVAGWLTSNYGSGAVAGVKAAMYGLGMAYLLTVGFFLVYWSLDGPFPPPVIVAFTLPFLNAFPLLVTHLVGGILAGTLGNSVASIRTSST